MFLIDLADEFGEPVEDLVRASRDFGLYCYEYGVVVTPLESRIRERYNKPGNWFCPQHFKRWCDVCPDSRAELDT